jgi:hypothetical protein
VKTAAGLQRHYQLSVRCAPRANARRKNSQDGEGGIEEERSANENGMEWATMELPEDRDPSPNQDTTDGEHCEFTVFETYLPTASNAEGEQLQVDDGGQISTGCGSSRGGHVEVVTFPGHAGESIGVGNPTFATFHSSTQDSSTRQSHLVDPELWELVRWLMNSGLTAGARGDFFKLQKVSDIFVGFATTQLTLINPSSTAPRNLAVEVRIPVYEGH